MDKAYAGYLPGGAAWVAAGNGHGWEMALKWIESKKPLVAAAGWATVPEHHAPLWAAVAVEQRTLAVYEEVSQWN